VEIKDRVVVVTGAGRGSGRAIALEFARLGARLALVARTESQIQEVAREIETLNQSALTVAADITDEGQIARMAERVVSTFGTVDVLVNNAGIVARGPVEATSLEEWNRILAVNVTGAFLCSRAFIEPMKRQKSGHIVNISSGAGKHGYANLAAYSASKFAVIGFSESLAAELGDWGIKVTTVVPGSIDTSFGGWKPGERQGVKLLKPEDVAQAIVAVVTQSERAWTQEMNLWPFK
jgi:NAD(P)-dependent dehydrogenase (short-subunit alcohol dehydrogenase family)